MLSLKNITKTYGTADGVRALRGVSMDFRQSEFVSILGPSGCGKTTLLNIIGGLDRYTDGDLIINGISTKQYEDRDWDTYRNHSVGFVFQSYQLIPHQTVLANVELALTLSGVGRAERRERARQALCRVGLGDQLSKKPNQMSGGQMQRVATARALVNDPDILLADEPTGALDTQTSTQIMELLKEVSRDRLVIMVTHNPELAELYSTRIIRLLDGQVQSDSMPYEAPAPSPEQSRPKDGTEQKKHRAKKARAVGQKTSMGFLTALTLSLNNLLTKKTRTALTSFAGSIGIVGIALILALSNGIQLYIDRVEADALSSYPISLEAYTMDMQSILTEISGNTEQNGTREDGYIYSSDTTIKLFQTMFSGIKKNDLYAFKQFLESGETDIADPSVSTVQYVYGVTPNVWYRYKNPESGEETVFQSSPSRMLNSITGGMGFGAMTLELFDQMLDNPELLSSQYQLLDGKWPTAKDEIVIVADKNNQINDLYLYALGLKDQGELMQIISDIYAGRETESHSVSFSYEQLLDTTFTLTVAGKLYEDGDGDGVYEYLADDRSKLDTVLSTADREGSGVITLHVVGIIKPSNDAAATSLSGIVGYTSALTDYLLEEGKKTAVVQAQLADPTTDVTTGLPFPNGSVGEMNDTQKEQQMLSILGDTKLTAESRRALYDELISITVLSAQQSAASLYAVQSGIAADMPLLINRLSAMIYEHYDELSSMPGFEGFGTSSGGMSQAAISMFLGSSMLTDEERIGLYVSMIAMYGNQSEGGSISPYVTALAEKKIAAAAMTDAEFAEAYEAEVSSASKQDLVSLYDRRYSQVSENTYREIISLLGYADPDYPTAINIYPTGFDKKDHVQKTISDYNAARSEEYTITYTDYIGVLFSSISLILNIITYVLVAFVAISLVVSSIMIGIITYISVLERTREIGILRAIGASKRDISRVFNAETLVIGFGAGLIGIVLSLLLMLPINAIIRALSGLSEIGASLPFVGAVVLIVISMLLTLVAGLIPSRVAARKDPVEALRSE